MKFHHVFIYIPNTGGFNFTRPSTFEAAVFFEI
jgi:hypothetical protein